VTDGSPGEAVSDLLASTEEIAGYIREVSDFPKRGISFKDITPLIANGPAFHAAVDGMGRATKGIDYSHVLSAEARGFVFGTALAYRARKGLILARRPNKLPRDTISASYELEYDQNSLEVHVDAISEGIRVLVVDDLLATGGTARAMCQLVEDAGGVVAGVAFLIELRFLGGRDVLSPYPVTSLVTYDD
jgi:adenine phosphoribosyltransferase